jgi:glycerophosphoryl diester phosphodiesterase
MNTAARGSWQASHLREARAVDPRPVQIIAHRGASKAERENTLAAFRTARRLGSDAVELDVRRGADGSLVVHHDAHLADGRPVAELSVEQLPDGIPVLPDALDACEGMWVNVEIKSDPREPDFHPDRILADAVVELLLGRPEPVSRWVISSFDREMIERVRQLAPELPTAWLTLDADGRLIRELAAAGHTALHPYVGFVTREMIDACHQVGLAVNTWTCDDPERMLELAGWGVDGICTNVPDIALHTLNRA